jgi:apolipoprotein N-acyltransferase
VLALASVGGVWLISFALVAANVAITLILVSRRAAPAVAAAVTGAAAAAAGPVIFALTPPAAAAGQTSVALVQPGLVHNPKLRTRASQRLTEGLVRRSRRGGARPDLIAWGESSVGFYLQADRSLLTSIERLSAREGAQILVNQDSLHDGKKTKVAVLVGPRGIDGTYTKTRLVPFGEYIPFRQALSWLTSISRAAPVDMAPGPGAHVMRVTLPGGRPMMIGPLICFESAFPDMSTFQGTWALAQHASLGAVRAAETGRPVVQAALTGDSAAFDPRGRRLAWMGETSIGVTTVRLTLPAPSSRTPYDRLGDYVLWTAVAVAALSALIALARRYGLLGGKTGARGGGEAQYDLESGLHVPG